MDNIPPQRVIAQKVYHHAPGTISIAFQFGVFDAITGRKTNGNLPLTVDVDLDIEMARNLRDTLTMALREA